MVSKYNSPFTVGKRQTVYIDANDPRVRGLKAGITAARLGAELVIVNSNTVSQAGQFSYLKGAAPLIKPDNFDPQSDEFTKPGSITNLSAAWESDTLVITFDFDFSNSQNKYVEGFHYYLTPDGLNKSGVIVSEDINKTSASQEIKFTRSKQISAFNIFHKEFDLLEIAAYDSFGNLGEFATLDLSGITYVPDLCTPVITCEPSVLGYTVNFTETCAKPFEYVSVEEVLSNDLTAPSSGYQQVYLNTVRPAKILAPTTESRWVKARYTDQAGQYGPYSNIVKVTPTGITADLTPPSAVISLTGAGTVNSNDPSGISGLITLTLVNPTYESDFAGYIVKIESSGNTWYQQFPTTSALTTILVNSGIIVGQSYNISVATIDIAGNVQTYTSAINNPVIISDNRVNTSVVTGLSVSVTDSIGTASWTAPIDPQVGSYRVMVTSNSDTSFSTPLQTIFTDSTQTSFGGLSSSTTYRLRVTTKYANNGPLSTQHTDTTFILNASGSISDGIAPTTNPSITTNNIKSLFKALTVTWPSITNPDAVSYEVFIKPTNSAGIVDDLYKVLEVSGTFAVIKTLADKTTELAYGTDYYIAIRAKDADGVSTGLVTPVGPVQTSQIANADLAADSVYANNIKAGEITADKMVTDLLFTNKTINVGESTSLNRIRLDANTSIVSGQSVKSRIYIGAGIYDDAATSFYADNVGRVSIKDKLKFDGTNLQIDANGSFGGLLTAGSGLQSIKIGLNAGGSNLHGIYISATSDYIYNSGNFRLGNGKITFNGSVLDISAKVDITGASTVTGNLTISGINSSLIVGNGTTNSVVIKNGASGLGGLVAFDGSGNGMTEILNTPVSSGGTTPASNAVGSWTDSAGFSVNFFTKGALIGGWLVTDRYIRDRSKQFVLDSGDINNPTTSEKALSIQGNRLSTNYYVKVGTGSVNANAGNNFNVIEAGTVGQKPAFYVTYEGNLNAENAILQGKLTTGSNDTGMKFGYNVSGANSGIYIGANNYWYDTGAFSFGSGIVSGTSSTVDFDVSALGVRFLNMPASDDDGFAGDPTITVRPSDSRLVKGRRFIFNGTGNVPTNPTGWSSITKTGSFTTNGGTTTEVKTGDIVMIY